MAKHSPSIWSTARFDKHARPGSPADKRTLYEQDYDRLLFSTPVRRLADKTQVFPLEKNDSVRTRLTHSHEVSNLARSLGFRLSRTKKGVFDTKASNEAAAPIILATVGLAHDLGNPPFGHQGEAAIGRWFEEHGHVFSKPGPGVSPGSDFQPVPKRLQADFAKFEGNAQTIRLLTRLQSTSGTAGLNLTAATLAALMKYTVPSYKINKSSAASKKFGFFDSDSEVVDWIRIQTGIGEGQRHPLTWLMEACDDIAYSVLDVEDTIKKGLVSAEDLRAFISKEFATTTLGGGLVNQLESDFDTATKANASLSRIAEIKASYVRTRLIDRLLNGAANTFLADRTAIFDQKRQKPLLGDNSFETELYEKLKEFARTYAYNSSAVLSVELQGSLVISKLMDLFWEAITTRKDFSDLGSRRTTPRAAYIYSKISESYRWHFEHGPAKAGLPIRYRELQLLTDMVAGMTDSFAVELCTELSRAAP